MIKHKNINKHIAIISAFLLTATSIPFKSFAKESTKLNDSPNIAIGTVAEPYVPDYVKLDKNNKPILDDKGNFIFINEKGDIIDKDILKDYTITANKDGKVIIKEDDETLKARTSKTITMKGVNLGSNNIMIRSSKSTSSTILGRIAPNDVVTILENDDSAWYKISFKNDSGTTKTGYCVRDGVVLVEEKSETRVQNISGASASIRSTSSESGSVLGSLPTDSVAYAIYRENGWIRIIYNDTCGWVSESLVKFTNPNSSKSLVVTSGELLQTVYGKSESIGINYKTSAQMLDNNNRHFYCMDPEKFAPNGHPYYRDKELDDGAYRILQNGYPNKSFTGDNTTDRVITQMAFWAYVDPASLDINDLKMINNGATDSSLLTHVKNLYNKATSDSKTQTVSVEFSKTQLTATLKNDSFETDYVTLVGKGDIKSATTTLSFRSNSNIDTTGIKVVDESNEVLSSISLGQKFKIVIPASIGIGDLTITGNSLIEHEKAIFYTSALAGVQDAATIETVNENKALANELNVSWEGMGDLSIIKTDSTTNLELAGAQFSIVNTSGESVQVLTTDSNGYAKSKKLPLGTYKIQEIKAPTGYILDNTIHTVNINSTTTVELRYTNDAIKGSVSIKKVDSEDNTVVLEGAEFTLYAENDTEVAKTTTDANGIVTFEDLAVGRYYIKETKAPSGYSITNDIKNFEITSNKKEFSFTVENSKSTGELDFSKTDVSTGDIIPGATIEITGLDSANSHINFSFVSSEEGNRFNLPVGRYEFRETIAPDGYVLSTEVGTFEITTNGQIVKAELENRPIMGSLKVLKVDAENKSPLTGAEFTLTDEEGNKVNTLKVNEDGIALFENLKVGSYTLTETKAPNGYQLLTHPMSVDIREDGKVIELTVENSKSTGELDFSKTDVSTGDIIPGATIEITGLDNTNNHINFSFVSSEEGNRFNLPVGRYEFRETIAPDGYVLSTEVGTFEITTNGQIVKAELQNRPIMGSLKVIKVDAEDNSSLIGAEFTLTDEEGNEVNTLEVNEDGIALFENLRAGVYTLTEIKAPDGYQLADNSFEVNVTQDGEVIELTVKNSKSTGELDFSKVDVSTGDLLPGATIEIIGLDESNNYVNFSFVSSEEGNRFTLPLGNYQFSETAAPDGYVLSTEVGTFEIKANGEVVKATLENRPISGNLKVLKVDSKTGHSLTGAEFTLYDEVGDIVSTLEVDEDGIALFENLRPGNYFLEETQAPINYQISDETFDVEIIEDGETVEITVKNDAKLAQTGGDYTFNQFFLSGGTLLILGLVLLRQKGGRKFNE